MSMLLPHFLCYMSLDDSMESLEDAVHLALGQLARIEGCCGRLGTRSDVEVVRLVGDAAAAAAAEQY